MISGSALGRGACAPGSAWQDSQQALTERSDLPVITIISTITFAKMPFAVLIL
jgi:hypothetical protein